MMRSTRQTLISSTALLLLTLFSTAFYLFLASSVEEYAREHVRAVARNAASLLENWLSDYEEAAEFAAVFGQSTLGKKQDLATFAAMARQTTLGRHQALQIDGKGFFLLDENEVTPIQSDNKRQGAWLQLFSQSMGPPPITGPIPSIRNEGHEFLISRLLLTPSGRRFGVLALRISLLQLSEKMHSFASPEIGGRSLFVLSGSSILAPTDVTGAVRPMKEVPLLAELGNLQNRKMGETFLVSLGKKEYFVCQEEVRQTGWRLLLLSPAEWDLNILPLLRGSLIFAWISLTAFIFFLFFQARKYNHYKILSELDHLTGTGNRLAFEKALTHLNQQQNFPVSLLMMDVDGLKMLNDTLGHEAGDALLRRVAFLLQRSLRDHDAIYRIGGDEFAVIVPGTSYATALPLVERIRINASMAREKSALPPIFISHGLAEALNSEELASLYRRADETMYANKDMHRAASNQALRQWLAENPHQEERRQPPK